MKFIYAFLVNPLLLMVAHIAAVFRTDIREAVAGRYATFKRLNQWLKTDSAGDQKTILLHAASMGEFEHIKPLILALKRRYGFRFVVTFFSPSGFNHVKRFEGVALFIYMPFDFGFLWKRLYRKIKPRFLIISKHDVWPNQVWTARKMGLPVFLVNASLAAESSRLKIPARWFMGKIYNALDGIYAISKEDRERFRQNFGLHQVQTVGDTKFDQVLIRKKQSRASDLIDPHWFGNNKCLLFGSIWPEDGRHIVPVLKKILNSFHQLKAILVPHQIHESFIKELEDELGEFHPVRFTTGNIQPEQRILIVDAIGKLADLYRYAQVAYVGGSFKQGIHNVMEPAVYGIPVLFGPVYRNSLEAIKLQEVNGAFSVKDSHELETVLYLFLIDDEKREEAGARAQQFAEENLGATDRILADWRSRKLISAEDQ